MNSKKPATNLSDVVRPYSHVRMASENEGRELSRFSSDQLMAVGETGVGFDRGSDFFSLFRIYTKQYWVFAILNDDGSLAGTAAISRFQAKLGTETRWIGYLSDLRLDHKANFEAHRQWRSVYQDIVAHLENPESFEHCDHLITAVFQENLRAMRIFKGRLKKITYHELTPYWNLSIFRSIFARKKNDPLQVFRRDSLPIETLVRPDLAMSSLPLGKTLQPLIVKDQSERTVFGAILADNRDCRRLRVTNLPSTLKWAFWVLSGISRLKYTDDVPWIMKGLGSFCWDPAASSIERLRALEATIKFCFSEDAADFHFLNLTLMNENHGRYLRQKFPISKLTAGWLFEVTSAARTSTLLNRELIFEGSFL